MAGIPDYQSLMLPLLEVARKGETSVPLASDEIAERFQLNPGERMQLLPSGKQSILHNRVHWAKLYLTKAGLLESPRRGRFIISDAGRELLSNPPQKIDTKYLLTIPSFRNFYKGNQESETTEPVPAGMTQSTPEEIIESIFNATQTSLQTELLERILQNSPAFFESLIIDLLVKMGYGGSHRNATAKLGRSGDGGVDGVINQDILGLDRVYIQAKRYALNSSVGRPDVQAFTGSLVGLGANKGVFVTTSTFSPQAVEFIARIPQSIILIDGKKLTELMISHSVGVRQNRIIEFKRLDEDFFSEE